MKNLITVILVLLSFAATSQSFEGKITYHNTYKSKLPNLTDEQFTTMFGTIMDYYIKDGDYKTTTNGTMLTWQIYSSKDNKLYNKLATTETLLWNDGSTEKTEITKIEVNKNAIQILGLSCDELIFHLNNGVQKFYYNSKWKIDPKLYEKHKYQHWNEYITEAKAVPLKMIIDNEQFYAESIATEVVPEKLDAKLFEIPAGVATAPSPY